MRLKNKKLQFYDYYRTREREGAWKSNVFLPITTTIFVHSLVFPKSFFFTFMNVPFLIFGIALITVRNAKQKNTEVLNQQGFWLS